MPLTRLLCDVSEFSWRGLMGDGVAVFLLVIDSAWGAARA